MKKLHLIALLLVTLCTFSLTGCKDDDENVSPRTSLLTDGEWRGDGIYAGTFPVTTLLQFAGETELAEALNIKTTTFDFERDGTFEATKDGVTETGTWRFTNNEESIIISGDNLTLTGGNANEVTFDIVQLTASNFNLEIDVQELGYDLSDYGNFSTVQLRLVK
ncbi:hypothetical protein [Pontibacter pamirensis]|uniref:hypothetical protein n=1 Tax=Pontibacter pamirensis TaxID=2562824 RepID=UPI0013895790|nr:hypothetical protein [Pontibacter pamirensis]